MRYVAIRSEGGLIPYDLLNKIASEEVQGQKPGDFGLPKGRRLTDEISRVWSDAQSLWDILRRRRDSLSEKDPYGTTLTRERWIVPLLSDPDMLSFDLKLQTSAAIVNNISFPISHRSGEGDDAIPVHIEGLKIDLDKRLHTKLRTSPQAMVQEFLNHSESVLWGIVTNGLTFRILRDSSRTSRPTYLEFDLESILEGNRFAEFALFYRLCHRSRFPRPGQEASECLLEKHYQQSIDEGSRVREGLRDGVEATLRILGNAFLQHPANTALRERLASGRLTPIQIHRQLLLLVYRLLFLMVAEERKLIAAQGEGVERNQKLYDEWYSVTQMRDRAAQIVEESPFGDLWIGLLKTFDLFEYGIDTNQLGIPPLNGDLFNRERAVPDLVPEERFDSAGNYIGTQLYNHDLLTAIRHLSTFEDKGARQRVNYSALDVEELGSVYESLLDYQPVVEQGDSGPKFDLRTGSERKSTGSYYTRPELVHELIESALVPVMQDRIAQAEKETEGQALHIEREAKIKAILSMTVCDPAAGSGHFLLAAARRLGKELARIKTGEDEPTPEQFHLGVRDIIQHCIYGVDLNPLAVDLCKLALWLEGHWAGKPLSFLDHRIRCGNSLIGVLDPKVLEDGIPDDAFTAVTGDDKKVAAYLKKRNKQDRTSRGFVFEPEDHATEYAASNRELRELRENTPAEVRKKAQMYSSWRSGMQHSHDEAVADLWTAQFFVPLTSTTDPSVCTTKDFLEFAMDKRKKSQQVAAAQEVAQRVRFFHWRLEFPEVFENDGFDVVLGNPPWERIKLQEKEHWIDDPYIANAANKAERGHRIEEYRQSGDPVRVSRVARFEAAKHDSEAEGKCIRNCARFRLTAVGDVNTYALFAELSRQLISSFGRVGVLVPTGIVTDDTTKDFFADIASRLQLSKVIGFENEDFIFPAVHHAFKFCALTISGEKVQARVADLVFWCRAFADVNDQRRYFRLSGQDFKTISPNTQTCPTFRTGADAALSLKLYRNCPVLWDEQRATNEWRIQFLRMIDMANDSGLFLDSDGGGCLPLYEAKMMHQFDHRWGTYAGATRENLNAGILPQVSETAKQDPAASVTPRYWVEEAEARKRTEGWTRNWLLGFRDITAAMVERTGIFSVLPYSAVGHSISLMLPLQSAEDREWPLICCLLANLNSLVTDFVIRTKLTYIHLSYFVLKQIPVLQPQKYSSDHIGYLVPRVLELVYTSDDLRSFADDVYSNADESVRQNIKARYAECGVELLNDRKLPPFRWSNNRRANIRAEIDAYYAHLYGLTRSELRYVLEPKELFGPDFPSETFRVLMEREIKVLGEYRTQRLVLEAYDELAKSDRFRAEMPTRVSAFEIPTAKTHAAR